MNPCLVTRNGDNVTLQFEGFRLQRKQDESPKQCLARLRKRLSLPDETPITFLDTDKATVDKPTLCEVLEASCWIQAGDDTWKVLLNPLPAPVKFSVSQRIFQGFPVIAFTDVTAYTASLTCEWYVISDLTELYPVGMRSQIARTKVFISYSSEITVGEADPAKYGRLVGTGFVLKEAAGDTGQYLVAKVMCKDMKEVFGIVISNDAIEAPPPTCDWYLRRSKLIEERKRDPAETIRICSWNLLAPVYASTEHAITKMFPYCPEEAIAFHYRKPMLAKHILEMDADIYCFQEVGLEPFGSLLSPLLHDEYAGTFFAKKSNAAEGLSIYVRRSRFLVTAQETFPFKFLFPKYYSDICHECDRLWGEMFTAKVIEKMSSVVGTLVVMDKVTQLDMAIANCHFYWHPLGSHIRGLQAYFAVKEALKLCPKSGTVIVAGDMNSNDGTAAIDLLSRGSVGSEHPSWAHAKLYGYGTFASEEEDAAAPPAEAVMQVDTVTSTGPALDLGNGGLSNCQLQTLEFTNHIGVFKAVLDWVFGTVEPIWSLPGVKLDEIAKHDERYHRPLADIGDAPIGLLTAAFPSDHLSILTEIKTPRKR